MHNMILIRTYPLYNADSIGVIKSEFGYLIEVSENQILWEAYLLMIFYPVVIEPPGRTRCA